MQKWIYYTNKIKLKNKIDSLLHFSWLNKQISAEILMNDVSM